MREDRTEVERAEWGGEGGKMRQRPQRQRRGSRNACSWLLVGQHSHGVGRQGSGAGRQVGGRLHLVRERKG